MQAEDTRHEKLCGSDELPLPWRDGLRELAYCFSLSRCGGGKVYWAKFKGSLKKGHITRRSDRIKSCTVSKSIDALNNQVVTRFVV